MTERTQYEPYGQSIGKAVDGVGYTGHVSDAASGLVYMQQRYYDPQIGRFLSVDPVTAYSSPVGAFNRYRYADNNPYRFSDPDGRYSCDGSKAQCVEIARFRDKITEARRGLPEGSDARAKVDRVAGYLGRHGENNGVIVKATRLSPGTTGESNGKGLITLDLAQIKASGEEYADVVGGTTLAHEGRHEIDAEGHGRPDTRSKVMRTELNAYSSGAAVARGLGMDIGLGTDEKIKQAAERSTQAWCAEPGSKGC